MGLASRSSHLRRARAMTDRLAMLAAVTKVLTEHPDLPVADVWLVIGAFPAVEIRVADDLDVNAWGRELDAKPLTRPYGLSMKHFLRFTVDGIGIEVHSFVTRLPPSYDVHTEQAMAIVRGTE